jgi:hypothetical protein
MLAVLYAVRGRAAAALAMFLNLQLAPRAGLAD